MTNRNATVHGQIVRALSGFYDIETADGTVYRTKARGQFRLKKKAQTPLVGDWVEVQLNEADEGTIIAIDVRKNRLQRPPVANIDWALVVLSVTEPMIPTKLIDRLLVACEAAAIRPALYFTKEDLVTEASERDTIKERQAVYRAIGYPVLSSADDDAVDALYALVHDQTVAVMGQSGVGKTTLINMLIPDAALPTGAVSQALGRGRHTTRHVEIHHANGWRLIDTPGFSSLSFDGLTPETLAECFPEIWAKQAECRFRGCRHINEPGCAVKQAVEDEAIAAFRYQNYAAFYQEIDAQTSY